MRRAHLKDLEYYLPDGTLDNETLIEKIPALKSAKNIFEKTGIRKRHIASADECASDLAVKAAEKLFDKNPSLREKVDFLIFCTQSPDYSLPTTACLLQERLKLSTSCGAIDINQGCSGFIYSLSLAKSLIESGLAENIILLTAETYSKYIADGDKSTQPIFGDGAAAVYIDTSFGDTEYIRDFVFGTDGSGAENLILKESGSRHYGKAYDKTSLFMNGPEIFQFALSVIPRTVHAILEKSRLDLKDIDYFIFHQANAFILNHLRMKLKIPKEKFCVDMEDIGNTVSSSIPIALGRALKFGVIKSDMCVMLLGFGVGYSWGGCILRL